MTHPNDAPVIEATTPIGAAPEAVYAHLVNVEGIGFVDHIAQDIGRRAMALVSPDAQGETLLTVVVESSEDPRVAARLETVVRSELNRLARILHEQRVPAGSRRHRARRDPTGHRARRPRSARRPNTT